MNDRLTASRKLAEKAVDAADRRLTHAVERLKRWCECEGPLRSPDIREAAARKAWPEQFDALALAVRDATFERDTAWLEFVAAIDAEESAEAAPEKFDETMADHRRHEARDLAEAAA